MPTFSSNPCRPVFSGSDVPPQEIEDFLMKDQRVIDCAVFGIPNEEFGESVQAIVQVADASDQNSDLAAELKRQCHTALGSIKAPKNIQIVTDFPRLPTGKLHKKALRDEFLSRLAAA